MCKFIPKISIVVAIVAAVFSLISLNTREAMAQVKPALVKNLDEPGRIPYQQYVEMTLARACWNNGCSSMLAPVPAGKRLVITDFYGTIALNSGAIVTRLRLESYPPSMQSTDILFEVPPDPNAYYTDQTNAIHYPFHKQFHMYVEQNHIPAIRFHTVGGNVRPDEATTMAVVGYLVDLNY